MNIYFSNFPWIFPSALWGNQNDDTGSRWNTAVRVHDSGKEIWHLKSQYFRVSFSSNRKLCLKSLLMYTVWLLNHCKSYFFSVNSSSFYICKAIFYDSSWVDVLYFLYSYYLNLNWFYFCLYIQTAYVCSLVTIFSF